MDTNYRIFKQGEKWYEVQSWRDVPGVMNWYTVEGYTETQEDAELVIRLFEARNREGAYQLLYQYE